MDILSIFLLYQDVGKSYTRIQGVPFPILEPSASQKGDSSELLDQGPGSELETSLPLTPAAENNAETVQSGTD